ncbi:MAG: hypothetical protein V4539_03425 [Bacteroidota bacterium]
MKKKFLVLFSSAMLLSLYVLAQPPQPPKPPTAEERLKHVSEKINKEITLTAPQKAKVEAAYKDFFADIDKLRAKNGKKDMPPPPPPPPPGSKEEMDKLTKARDAKIKTALSEAQYKKYTEIEKTLRPPRPEGGPGKQGPPPPDKKQ